MNRKLIRTTLADVKARREQNHQRERTNGHSQSGGMGGGGQQRPGQPQPSSSVQVRKRQPPPAETHAEIYYYKKQIDAHTPMVLVLLDGEEVEGTIEWYDRGALKINRRSAPNLLVLKRHIKYIFKAEERVSNGSNGSNMTRVEDDLPHSVEN